MPSHWSPHPLVIASAPSPMRGRPPVILVRDADNAHLMNFVLNSGLQARENRRPRPPAVNPYSHRASEPFARHPSQTPVAHLFHNMPQPPAPCRQARHSSHAPHQPTAPHWKSRHSVHTPMPVQTAPHPKSAYALSPPSLAMPPRNSRRGRFVEHL